MQSVMFIAHGNPLNALADNQFTRCLRTLGQDIQPVPKAILVISAHWLAGSSQVNSTPHPETIHDFFGFPDDLYKVQYPCPGSPETADKILLRLPELGVDQYRGLDHGVWSVLKHIYPRANIPILQLSIDIRKPPLYQYELGKKLRFLREDNVLVLGSGNIVHNLREVDFSLHAVTDPRNIEFDLWVASMLQAGDHQALVDYRSQNDLASYAVPTPDHYYPLLYCLGATDSSEQPQTVYSGYEHRSLSMRCVSWSI